MSQQLKVTNFLTTQQLSDSDLIESLRAGVAAADALPKTIGWKPGEALAAALDESGHLQRALVASVRQGPTPSGRDLARLKAYEACLPTLAWLESGLA